MQQSRNDEVIGKIFVALSQDMRQCLICDGVFTDLTGEICTRWNERESTWRKNRSCPSRGTNQSKS
jgi:hypothetical protein